MLEFGPDQGLQGQVVDIVRMLLDPDSMDQSPEKDPFLELFYDKYVGELINLLVEGAEQDQQQTQEQLDAFRRQEQVCLANTHTLHSADWGMGEGGRGGGTNNLLIEGAEQNQQQTQQQVRLCDTHVSKLCRMCAVSQGSL